MTRNLGAELPERILSLLHCCCEAMGRSGGMDEEFDKLSRKLLGANGRKALDQIIRTARESGFRASVLKPQPQQLAEVADRLPAVIELKHGTYAILQKIEIFQAEDRIRLHISHFRKTAGWLDQKLTGEEFFRLWAGGILLFERINTGLVCFSLVAREHKIELTSQRLQHEFNLSRHEIEPKRMLRMAKDIGLKARQLRLDWDGLEVLGKAWPAIAKTRNGRHLVLTGLVKTEEQGAKLACYDPLAETSGAHRLYTREEFEKIWSGTLFLFKRKYLLADQDQPFGLRWFIPEILRQKLTFVDIGLAVLFINLISLVTPIFFQIVIDKVLVNQAFTTLQVLGIGMTVALLVNAGLDFLRDYLLLHATNKIDLRVTGRTFRHLLQLPLGFFEHAAAGVLTQHMQQTSKIRNFLTGNVFLTLLEATSLFVFLPFLFFYSLKLTAIVLLFTSLIALVIGCLMVPFKRRLNRLYEAEGDRQAMLVETINGMSTVKAMAIEPLLRQKWEDTVAKAVSMQFRVGKISITARSLTQLLERLMTVILIWVGASLVFDNTITVGALIAFQMLAGRVTSPLVRLVGLVHQYQEAALSVEKLGTVMNAKPEWGADRHGARPSLAGDIVFDRVRFRYKPDLPDALKDLTLTIPAGSVMGIVGPSGSGKTTLTRMLQKSYFPTSGTIRINNCYLNELDTAHLRRNMGVVLQESFLFNATIAENIRAGQARATREEIIRAAILAGADEFIVKLPQGYDTVLEEGARNLSGGQRQRLAIARALLTSPRILILDEATSSLDPESERIVRENLKEIARNRTVLIVSHRLSMLKDADAIMVLEEGKLVGLGKHDHLLSTCRLYNHLWKQQMEL